MVTGEGDVITVNTENQEVKLDNVFGIDSRNNFFNKRRQIISGNVYKVKISFRNDKIFSFMYS